MLTIILSEQKNMVKSLNYKMNRGKNVIASSLEDSIQINIDQLKKPDDIRHAFILDNG